MTDKPAPFPALDTLLNDVIQITIDAGKILMEQRAHIKDKNFIEIKADDSPVTKADKMSSAYIVDALNKITPNIPVVSEENATLPEAGKPYWAIDPLDGTKMFIGGNKGFAVNIALMVENDPVLGVVHCPALARTYYTATGMKSYKQDGNNTPVVLNTGATSTATTDTLKAAFDVVHGNIETYNKAKKIMAEKFSLQLPDEPIAHINIEEGPFNLLVAEGKIDMHVKTGNDITLKGSSGYIWDNAASQLILRHAGGGLFDLCTFFNGVALPADARKPQHAYIAMANGEIRDSLLAARNPR